jgi:hypothetical protein
VAKETGVTTIIIIGVAALVVIVLIGGVIRFALK